MLNTWGMLMTLALVVTGLAFWKPHYFTAAFAFCVWVAMLDYHSGAKPDGIVAGSDADSALVMLFVILLIGVPFYTVVRVRSGNRASSGGNGGNSESQIQSRNLMDLDESEYKALIKGKMGRK